MLRLDPAHPPLWRDIDTLQFGVPAVVRLDSPEPWQERLLHELGRGISESGVDVWAEFARIRTARARAFVAELAPVLLRTRLEEREPPAPVASVRAAAPGSALARAVVLGLGAAGWDVRSERSTPGSEPGAEPDSVDLVVLIADHRLDARRTHVLMTHDRAHLPVVSTGAGVVVGPLVRPGDTACATCVDLHRHDEDAHWPALAAQLADAVPAPVPAIDALEAAAAVVRAAAAVPAARASRSDDPEWRSGAAVTVRDGVRTERAWEPHPQCGCRMSAVVPLEARAQPRAVRELGATA